MANRRNFIQKVSSIGCGIGLASTFPSYAKTHQNLDRMFLHHVFFWLKDPDNPDKRKKFEKGLEGLASVETIKIVQIGIPADTNRDVIDNSYHYSFLAGFKDKAGHDVYQKHQKHLDFIDKCADLWERVLVYDTEGID